MGAGPGSFGVPTAGYTGPGDIQTFTHYWGLRCYNNAYSGNVADIRDTATGTTTETLLTCTAGGTINQTINPLATTCATSCSVETLYDQASTANQTWASRTLGPTLSISLLVTPSPDPDRVWWKWEVLENLASADAIEGEHIDNPVVAALALVKADIIRFGIGKQGA